MAAQWAANPIGGEGRRGEHVKAKLEIPQSAERLTPEWLTAALQDTGTIKASRVESFDTSLDIAAGVGFMGELARLTLRYDRAEDGAPRSLIAKFPTRIPENREIADVFRLYERETRFYEEVAPEVKLRTPRRYYGALNSETQDYVLLLEDLAPARVGDQLEGCSAEEAELCIRQLAMFHATWWESPRLAEIDWMPLTSDPLIAQSAQDAYSEAWSPFAEYAGDRLSDQMRAVGERFGKNIVNTLNRFGEPPRTIVHGDYRLDNLFFGTPEGGAPLTVIDWQISSRGSGVFDVAYFICGTMPPADRRAVEMDLLRIYHAVLLDGGVRGYDFDQCFEDYRASMLGCLLYSVLEIGSLDTANERGLELFTAIMERALSAVADLNAGELLPQ